MQNKTLNSPLDIELDLMQFIGTENYYHRNYPFVYTDGVQYIASKLEAYWLLEAIASHQLEIKKSKYSIPLQDYQFWTFKASGNKGVLTCDLDKGQTVITQAIDYTDFPLSVVKLWLINMFLYWNFKGEKRGRSVENYGTLILPTEY